MWTSKQKEQWSITRKKQKKNEIYPPTPPYSHSQPTEQNQEIKKKKTESKKISQTKEDGGC